MVVKPSKDNYIHNDIIRRYLMGFTAYILKILIASPSDVVAERKAIPEVIHAWNAVNAEEAKTVLLPIMWETHSTPEMGERPQEIINRQLVDSCDFLIGVFWTRIGTHTGKTKSGTVEEIERFIKANKPVLLYFSSVPVRMDSVDQKQYEKLKNFKDECKAKGLIENYSEIPELREKLNRHLSTTVRKISPSAAEKFGGISETQFPSQQNSIFSIREQLKTLLSRAEVDWVTEKDSQPMNIDGGKYILESLGSELMEFSVLLNNINRNELAKKLNGLIKDIKITQQHRLYPDGGKSYRKFWANGDRMFDEIRQFVSEFK
jgi:hypothetical protein